MIGLSYAIGLCNCDCFRLVIETNVNCIYLFIFHGKAITIINI